MGSITTTAVVSAWLLAAGGSYAALVDYAGTPGAAASVGAHWPSDTTLTRQPGKPTLVVVLHPLCSCSRSTLAELERLVARASNIDTIVIVSTGVTRHPELAERAAKIPGARVARDESGNEAKRFGAVTSGHTVLFDVAGTRAFTGGITAARGHEGANAGVDAILRHVAARAAVTAETPPAPVYGCSFDGKDGG